MWKSNFCTTLTRQNTSLRLIKDFINPSILRPSFSIRQLVASSFYKTRSIFRYILRRNAVEVRPLPIYPNLTRNFSDNKIVFSSILYRFVSNEGSSSQKFHTFISNPRFKLIRSKFLSTYGITFGLIGVYVKNENGCPALISEDKSIKTRIDLSKFFQSVQNHAFELKELREDINKTEHISFKDAIAKGCCGVVYKGEIRSRNGSSLEPVAVKMLFNYDIESNAQAIISSTIKECLPYNGKFGMVDVKRKRLPPHPNIVKILSVFADYFQPLENCEQLYPHALPYRFGGYGRNMTLFVVQKLYDMSLKEYLNLFPTSKRTSLAILTQSLDAIEFLNKNKISHRDLKTDNILVSLPADKKDFPWVVITDFGMSSNNLQIPFQTEEVCRGGNRALMAPEIVNIEPSKNAFLDYSKSDLWAMGTIAYEIFGADNPFYKKTFESDKLDSATYHEDKLPEFPSKSQLLSRLIIRILSKNPERRPTPQFASDLCHLLFQMGSTNTKHLSQISNIKLRNQIVEEWFKFQSYRTMYDIINEMHTKTSDYKMKIIFLTKFGTERILNTLDKIQDIVLL